MMRTTTASAELQNCIDACTECQAACWEAINSCLVRPQHADPDHVALLLTCADMCCTHANAMVRGSPALQATCLACIQVCRRCAEACEQIPGDPHMRSCAQACRQCADHCEAMTAVPP